MAAAQFTPAQGRWPEVPSPAMRLGALAAFLGTTASMIALINNLVAGAGVALLTRTLLPALHGGMAVAVGVLAAGLLTWAFLAYQRWRFALFDPQFDQQAK